MGSMERTSPMAEQPRDISSAPRDGTKICMRVEHMNFAFASEADKPNWEQWVEAQWIDFNGGGWTWYGLCGKPTHWTPLPPPISDDEASARNEEGYIRHG